MLIILQRLEMQFRLFFRSIVDYYDGSSADTAFPKAKANLKGKKAEKDDVCQKADLTGFAEYSDGNLSGLDSAESKLLLYKQPHFSIFHRQPMLNL